MALSQSKKDEIRVSIDSLTTRAADISYEQGNRVRGVLRPKYKPLMQMHGSVTMICNATVKEPLTDELSPLEAHVADLILQLLDYSDEHDLRISSALIRLTE